jgi:hypothetical protein
VHLPRSLELLYTEHTTTTQIAIQALIRSTQLTMLTHYPMALIPPLEWWITSSDFVRAEATRSACISEIPEVWWNTFEGTVDLCPLGGFAPNLDT